MLAVVIQAGGESRRMGRDKGLAPFLGRPLITRIIERLEPIASEMIVTTNHPEAYQFLGLPLFSDLIPGRGALGGLYTALSAATQPLAAVVACDMPFVRPELLAVQRDLLLEKRVDAVVPHLGGGVEPFHAVYRCASCLPHIKAALDADKWRADAWFSKANVLLMRKEQIQTFDPELSSFSNVNTPEELHLAEEIALRQQTGQ
ncbi:MAG: molybdenum cofactor guanylyltransferase [Anaerolineales bacterium]|nr:molybdenum cofactor guanylyltransferase [Anaerolineales bacterium]